MKDHKKRDTIIGICSMIAGIVYGTWCYLVYFVIDMDELMKLDWKPFANIAENYPVAFMICFWGNMFIALGLFGTGIYFIIKINKKKK